MGRAVAQTVAARLGRTLLELGGNNGMIVAPSADLELAVRSIVFAAAGTCGQRCTTLRRLIVHESIADELRDRILTVFDRLPIGDPTRDGVLVGPLIDEQAFDAMEAALAAAQQARRQGARRRPRDRRRAGRRLLRAAGARRNRARRADHPAGNVRADSVSDALSRLRRSDPHPQRRAAGPVVGDSHARRPRGRAVHVRAAGSDCGIVNVNVGTSGAEIGGAFGGEKETGGGRESGSDSWKAYMRRVTSTVNYSDALPLAQGIKFDV